MDALIYVIGIHFLGAWLLIGLFLFGLLLFILFGKYLPEPSRRKHRRKKVK